MSAPYVGVRLNSILRESGCAEVPAHEVGLAILQPLKELDAVAYLRFASVYKQFESPDDFVEEIATLMSATADDEAQRLSNR